jgi:cis-3-alkyl-4-acyloxetan-2-one decarboxylase
MLKFENEFIQSGLNQVYPFKGRYFNQGKFQQHYLDIGQGPVLLMLHGNPTWSIYYRNLVQKFSQNFRVIVPDHMGCGFSEKPKDGNYTLEQHIENTKRLLVYLGVQDFHMVVHDWGGAIGYGLATNMPERVKSIVTFNTGAFRMNFIPKRIALCKLPMIGEFIVRRFNAFAWPATFMATEKGLPKIVKKAYLFPYNNYENRLAIAKFVQDIPLSKHHPSYELLTSIEKKLPALKMPKCFIWGMKDFCFNEKFLKRFRDIYPDQEFHILPKAGHYVVEDETDKVIHFMEHFYRRVL